jgi:hypothetical protein
MGPSVRDDADAVDANEPPEAQQRRSHNVTSSPYLELEHPFTFWYDNTILFMCHCTVVSAKWCSVLRVMLLTSGVRTFCRTKVIVSSVSDDERVRS